MHNFFSLFHLTRELSVREIRWSTIGCLQISAQFFFAIINSNVYDKWLTFCSWTEWIGENSSPRQEIHPKWALSTCYLSTICSHSHYWSHRHLHPKKKTVNRANCLIRMMPPPNPTKCFWERTKTLSQKCPTSSNPMENWVLTTTLTKDSHSFGVK